MIILTKFSKVSLVQCREFWDNLPLTSGIGLGFTPPYTMQLAADCFAWQIFLLPCNVVLRK